jgi:hypothetical protein
MMDMKRVFANMWKKTMLITNRKYRKYYFQGQRDLIDELIREKEKEQG